MTLNRGFYRTEYLGVAPPRSEGRIRVVAIPETNGGHGFSPCAYIRLLLPLDYLQQLGVIDLRIASPEQACELPADILFCQRTSDCNVAQAEALLAHGRRTGAAILYDLDDNLLEIDDDHPERLVLELNVAVVRTFLRGADAVFCSTARLRERVERFCKRSLVMRNGLDQRLLPSVRPRYGAERDSGSPRDVIGILYMGTQTHSPDLEMMSSALTQLAEEFGTGIRIGILGVTASSVLPRGVSRVAVPGEAAASYPAFMSWLSGLSDWHIGIAPLKETRFNQGKSMVKALDYAAMGIMPIVSDVPAYEDLPMGVVDKVKNDPGYWFEALRTAVIDAEHRAAIAKAAHAYLYEECTLAAQLESRLNTLGAALAR